MLLNSFSPSQTVIFGTSIFFLHIRSPVSNALPLLLTHGWPGSILEFRHVISPLTDPASLGKNPADAFHLIIPALPGHGFSAPPLDTGWNPARIAQAWTELMKRLGYSRWVAQGGDWGSNVTAALGHMAPPGLIAVHLNTTAFDPMIELQGRKPSPGSGEDRAEELGRSFVDESGYNRIQSTRPQTLGYGLADSPAGQAAWILEKLHAWSQHDGAVETLFPRDEMLDNITIYWLANAAASSARLYWEKSDTTAIPITIPVGVTQFEGEQAYAPRHWAERYYKNIIHWREGLTGGHFAAWEQPQIFVDEVRECFRGMRRAVDRYILSQG